VFFFLLFVLLFVVQNKNDKENTGYSTTNFCA